MKKAHKSPGKHHSVSAVRKGKSKTHGTRGGAKVHEPHSQTHLSGGRVGGKGRK